MKTKYTNRIIPAGVIGENEYYIHCGKPTDNPNVSIYLLSNMGQEHDYSLWYLETLNEREFKLWSYKGEDYEKLLLELAEDFLEHVFDD